MQLFHNKYSITIGRLSEMIDTQNPRLVCVHSRHLPKAAVKRAYMRFIADYEQMFAGSSSVMHRAETQKVLMWHKVETILPLLYQGLLYTPNEYFLSVYEEFFGDAPNIEDNEQMVAALKKVLREKERLRAYYRERFETPQKQKEITDEGITFEDIIINTELVLEKPLSRELKLYQFKKYFDLALEIARKRKNENHGRSWY